jgi:hypothetical protein
MVSNKSQRSETLEMEDQIPEPLHINDHLRSTFLTALFWISGVMSYAIHM